MPASICIWCLKSRPSSVEHIFPEALGCPPEFVLKTGVCRRCNNGLSHIDHALVHQFEMMAFMAGIQRKGGRPPAVHTWAGLTAAVTKEGPEIHINAGPQLVTALGRPLSSASARQGLKNITFQGSAGIGTVTFDQEIGSNPKFVRALMKVAVGTVAFFNGVERAASIELAPTRDFVKTGAGQFRALLLHQTDGQWHAFHAPWTNPVTDLPIVAMTIFGLQFVVDLDPQQRALATMSEKAGKEGGCNFIPPT